MRKSVVLCVAFSVVVTACGDKASDSGNPEASCSGEGIDGETLYADHCASCHEAPNRTGPNLANMMGHHDDDFILQTINDGWDDMPAFEGTLSCDEQHAVLDYLRATYGEYTGEGHH